MQQQYLSANHLVHKLNEDDLLPIALYYKAKCTLNNSTIYDYTKKRAAEVLGVSVYIFSKCLPYLKKHNLVREHSGNLTFVSVHKVRKENECDHYVLKVPKNKKFSLADIKKILYVATLKIKANHQDYAIRVCRKLNNRSRRKPVKNFEMHNGFILSTRRLANIFSCCHVKANEILKELKSDKYIRLQKYKKVFDLPKNISRNFLSRFFDDFKEYLPVKMGYVYFSSVKNKVYVYYGRKITFTDRFYEEFSL